MKILKLVSLLLIGCTSAIPKQKTGSSDTLDLFENKALGWAQKKNLFITGDFDGDHQQDTLRERLYSKTNRKQLDSFPDYNQYAEGNEPLYTWFNEQEAEVQLYLNKAKKDTLTFGVAFGLYGLINISDLNQDGKDEIAIAVNWRDFSNVNTCKIYTLCNKKWRQQKSFGIHEFSFTGDSVMPATVGIKNHLEKQNDIWFYSDYNLMEYESEEETGRMKELKVKKCR